MDVVVVGVVAGRVVRGFHLPKIHKKEKKINGQDMETLDEVQYRRLSRRACYLVKSAPLLLEGCLQILVPPIRTSAMREAALALRETKPPSGYNSRKPCMKKILKMQKSIKHSLLAFSTLRNCPAKILL